MPQCRDNECECGHLRDMHKDDIIEGKGGGECAWRTCSCIKFDECSAASMFTMKGKRPFSFTISGRGMCPESISMSNIKVYLQGILAHADQNNLENFDFPFKDKPTGKNFIFDMITRVEGN